MGSLTKRCLGLLFAGLFVSQADPEIVQATAQPQAQAISFQSHHVPPRHSGGHEVRGRLHDFVPPWYDLHSTMLGIFWMLQLQVPPIQNISRRFSTYSSPLSSFACFRSASQPHRLSSVNISSNLTSPIPSFSVVPPISTQLSALLRPLKEATLLKLDPKRAICQFEIPGAG